MIHEAGFLMNTYGRANTKCLEENIFTKKNNRHLYVLNDAVFEILTAWEYNLYDNLIGIVKGGVYDTEHDRKHIFPAYQKLKGNNDKNGLEYHKITKGMEEAIPSENNQAIKKKNIEVMYNSWVNLLPPVKNSFQYTPNDPITSIWQFKMQVLLADKSAIAMFCEIVRNPEHLLTTLKMIQKFYKHSDETYQFEDNVQQDVDSHYPTEVHPAMFGDTYYFNNQIYETNAGSRRLRGTGFRPIAKDFMEEKYFIDILYTIQQCRDEKTKQMVKGLYNMFITTSGILPTKSEEDKAHIAQLAQLWSTATPSDQQKHVVDQQLCLKKSNPSDGA